MSILRLLQQAQGGQGIDQLAEQLGIDRDQANQLTGMLAPAIGSAANRRVQSGGMADLLGALRGEAQARNFDNATLAASEEGREQGLDFLSALLGGRDQADELASEAATRAGVDSGTVQQFLPALAAMVQGGLQRQVPDSSIDAMETEDQGGGLMGLVGGLLGGGGGGGANALSRMLDADGDGSALDDILGRFIR